MDLRRTLCFAVVATFLLSLGACDSSGDGGPGVVGDSTEDAKGDEGGGNDPGTQDTTGDAANDQAQNDGGGNDPGMTDEGPDIATDDGGTEQAGLLCFDIMPCLLEACPDTESPTWQMCLQGALFTCLGQAESDTESNNFFAMLDCLNGCSDPEMSEEEAGACLVDECSDESGACNAGPEYGENDCMWLEGCLQYCLDSEDSSSECLRGCYAESSEDANYIDAALNRCVTVACASASQATVRACVQAAVAEGGACEEWLTACQTGIIIEPEPGPEAVEAMPEAVEAMPEAAEEMPEAAEEMPEVMPEAVEAMPDAVEGGETIEDVSTGDASAEIGPETTADTGAEATAE